MVLPLSIILILTTWFLAYSNGANDNFKGVATLFGSDTLNYNKAIWWATGTTFAGSIVSIFFASALVKNFSGKGLVPDMVAGSPEFLTAVGIGAGLTVFLATLTGFPISTTHSLTGALTGTGFAAVGMQVNIAALGNKFILPLLVSPILALTLSTFLYGIFHRIRKRIGFEKELCVCIGEKKQFVPVAALSGSSYVLQSQQTVALPEIAVDAPENCIERYKGRLFWFSTPKSCR